MLNAIDKQLLEAVADLHGVPRGAFNIRKNGEGIDRSSTPNIEIIPKRDKPGIDVIIKPGTRGESVHIPVIITKSGLTDLVYNTFEIGEGSDVLVVAGCGVHNSGNEISRHDGIHEIFVRKDATLRYVEKHLGQGSGGSKVLNPKTVIHVEPGGIAQLELVQLKGVDNASRVTEVELMQRSTLVINERLLTEANQAADSHIVVRLNGNDATAELKSRSVAKENSWQAFHFQLAAPARSRGHVECSSIVMDNAKVKSVPEISAEHPEAELTHEAAIGRIAEEQLIKLMSLGLSEDEAVSAIINGFLG